jgi:hypothetical protein
MRRGISASQLRSCITAQAMRAVLVDAIRRDGQPSGHALADVTKTGKFAMS